MPVFLNADDTGFEEAFAKLLSAKREDSPDVDDTVAAIIADVRARGDAALLDLTAKFDRLTLTPDTLRISAEDIAAATADVPDAERTALALAADRIRAYHERQLPTDTEWQDDAGATLGWERYTGSDGLNIGIDRFGASAPADDLFAHYGLTSEAIVPQIQNKLNN